MPDRAMTLNEKILTGLVVAALLFIGVALARNAYNRREIDALPMLPPEPVDDVCVCGHARKVHYERRDRTRGACHDRECACVHYEWELQPTTAYDRETDTYRVDADERVWR